MIEREVAYTVNNAALTRAKLTAANPETLAGIDKMVKHEQEQMIILKSVIKAASDLYFAEVDKEQGNGDEKSRPDPRTGSD